MKHSQGIEMRTVMNASVEAKSLQEIRWKNRPIRRSLASLFLCAGVVCISSAQLSAQNPLWPLVLIPNGETVYDVVNKVTWLADASLPVQQRFTIPLCDASGADPCVYPSGAMDYASATAWILAMNSANYLGHSNWQLPTAPLKDPGCAGVGPLNDGFGFGCEAGALGYIYYKALGFHAPNTAVPIPPNQVGPFSNFQPNYYWSSSGGGGSVSNISDFNFGDGGQGGGVVGDYLYALPMIQGKIPGTPPVNGTGLLQVNPDGRTVYDPVAQVTWLADANLAASDTLGLPRCQTPTTPLPYCVAFDGSMNNASAGQFINNMNAYDHGAGYLGQTNWQLPPSNATCPTYNNCPDNGNPMGVLFYVQFQLPPHAAVVQPPDIPVGPFLHLPPYHFWSCLADTIQEPCKTDGEVPAANSEWGFSFGNGYLGTARFIEYRYVTAYYVGCDLPGLWCSLLSRL